MSKEKLSTKFLDLNNQIVRLQNQIIEKQEILNQIAEQMHENVPVANVDLIINDGDISFTVILDENENYKLHPAYQYNHSKI